MLRVDSLALWKIMNEENAILIPKNQIEARTFQRNFALGNIWGGVSRYAATPLIVAVSPSHSDVTRFSPSSPIAIRNHLDRAEIIPKVS